MTQPAFSELAGAKKRTLIDWEKGVSSPTAVQLAAIAVAGVDVLYVVTGQRASSLRADLSAEEQTMLEYFRAASTAVRRAALGALLGAPAITQIGGNNSHHSTGANATHIGEMRAPKVRK